MSESSCVWAREERDEANLAKQITEELIARGVIARGDRIILTRGELSGVSGITNTMKILEA